MAEPQLKETQAQAPRQPALSSNPFHQAARADAMDAVRRITEGNAAQQGLGSISGIPLLRRAYIGSSLNAMDETRGEPQAFAQGREFLMLRLERGIMMIGLPEEFGLDAKAVARIRREGYREGDLPALDKMLKSYSEGGLRVTGIILSHPLDCLQFVNSAITEGGARRVRPMTGTDLADALARPGSAIIRRRADLLTEDRTLDTSNLIRDANPGDVMLFLSRVPGVATVRDARAWEEEHGDRVIWLDADGRPVDTRAMRPGARPGTPYMVNHSALYAGTDEGTGQPLIAQSHIMSGSISTESLGTYLMGGGSSFGAVAIVSFDYFSPPAVAARQ